MDNQFDMTKIDGFFQCFSLNIGKRLAQYSTHTYSCGSKINHQPMDFCSLEVVFLLNQHFGLCFRVSDVLPNIF